MSFISQDLFSQESDGNGMQGLLLGIWIGAIVLIFGQISFAISKVSKIMMSEADLMRKQPSHLAYLEWRWILGISISVLIFLVINSLIEMVMPMKFIGLVVVYNLLMLISGGVTGYLGMKQDDLLNQVEKISFSPRYNQIRKFYRLMYRKRVKHRQRISFRLKKLKKSINRSWNTLKLKNLILKVIFPCMICATI